MEDAMLIKSNLGGSTDFLSQGNRQKVRYAGCGSLEQTRMMWLYLSEMNIAPHYRCLHTVPDWGLAPLLRKRMAKGNYTTADLFPELYHATDPDCARSTVGLTGAMT